MRRRAGCGEREREENGKEEEEEEGKKKGLGDTIIRSSVSGGLWKDRSLSENRLGKRYNMVDLEHGASRVDRRMFFSYICYFSFSEIG